MKNILRSPLIITLLIFSNFVFGANDAAESIVEATESKTEASIDLEQQKQQLVKQLEAFVGKVLDEVPDLTDEQYQQVSVELGRMMLNQRKAMFNMMKARQESENFDRKQMRAMREEMMDSRANSMKKIKKVLSKDQYKAFEKAMETYSPKPQRGPGGGRRGGGGGMGGGGMG